MSQRRKSIRKAQKNQAAPSKTKTSMRQKLIIVGVVVLALLFVMSMFFSTPNAINNSPSNSSNQPATNNNARPAEPQFVKEGGLQFFKDGNITVAIDIEVANTAKEIEQGLMYRQKMDQNKGMLFIFPGMQPRAFWMKNTLMSLDIIYVDTEKTIVSIQKNAVPLSKQTLPSDGPAQYVIEVNAGFANTHGLVPGDKIDFQVE
jgi:uncharacterized membrane protein (UPF0127 family)